MWMLSPLSCTLYMASAVGTATFAPLHKLQRLSQCGVVWCVVLQLSTPGDPELQKLVLATGRVSDESLIRPGYPIEFADGVDVALDGIVYFSCATDVLPYK